MLLSTGEYLSVVMRQLCAKGILSRVYTSSNLSPWRALIEGCSVVDDFGSCVWRAVALELSHVE